MRRGISGLEKKRDVILSIVNLASRGLKAVYRHFEIFVFAVRPHDEVAKDAET